MVRRLESSRGREPRGLRDSACTGRGTSNESDCVRLGCPVSGPTWLDNQDRVLARFNACAVSALGCNAWTRGWCDGTGRGSRFGRRLRCRDAALPLGLRDLFRGPVRSRPRRLAVTLQSKGAHDEPGTQEDEHHAGNAQAEAQEKTEARDAGPLATKGEEQEKKCHDEDEEESSRPITIARLQNVFAELVDMLGICRRTGLSFDEFLCCFDRRLLYPLDGPDDGNDQGDANTEETYLAFNVVHAEDNFSWHQGWFSALALEPRAFRRRNFVVWHRCRLQRRRKESDQGAN